MRKNGQALTVVDVPDVVKGALCEFFKSIGRDIPEINDDTDLIQATGASSDEGVDFAIDLSEMLGVDVPNNFNPFVHESGRRGMKFRELVERSTQFLSATKESDHGG